MNEAHIDFSVVPGNFRLHGGAHARPDSYSNSNDSRADIHTAANCNAQTKNNFSNYTRGNVNWDFNAGNTHSRPG
ncbi:MAG TPA: hypothetical protein VJ022_02300 [Anaerolineales bacterium]|nr:hypothetical protein [Anaerolineales bacterium]